MGFDVGDVWQPQLTVKTSGGVSTAATVVLSVVSPSGVTSAPSVTTSSTGVYDATVPLTESGRWQATWTVSGAVVGVQEQDAYVRISGSNIIPVQDVRARLNKSLTVDDGEIQDMLDAALAEYVAYIGPLPGTVTEVFDGGGTAVVLASPTATITAASYDSGAALTYTDLTVQHGIVRWGYGTAGQFTSGARVSITYTVGSLPANHRETIIADVAGYFEATQRGGSGRPAFAGESDGGYTDAYIGHPQELFPRIRALAASYPTVA